MLDRRVPLDGHMGFDALVSGLAPLIIYGMRVEGQSAYRELMVMLGMAASSGTFRC
jgi:hypothetical protein